MNIWNLWKAVQHFWYAGQKIFKIVLFFYSKLEHLICFLSILRNTMPKSITASKPHICTSSIFQFDGCLITVDCPLMILLCTKSKLKTQSKSEQCLWVIMFCCTPEQFKCLQSQPGDQSNCQYAFPLSTAVWSNLHILCTAPQRPSFACGMHPVLWDCTLVSEDSPSNSPGDTSVNPGHMITYGRHAHWCILEAMDAHASKVHPCNAPTFGRFQEIWDRLQPLWPNSSLWMLTSMMGSQPWKVK